MRPRNAFTPYMASTDPSVNTSISIMKLRNYIGQFDPTYKPISLYQSRLKSRRAWHRLKRHTVR